MARIVRVTLLDLTYWCNTIDEQRIVWNSTFIKFLRNGRHCDDIQRVLGTAFVRDDGGVFVSNLGFGFWIFGRQNGSWKGKFWVFEEMMRFFWEFRWIFLICCWFFCISSDFFEFLWISWLFCEYSWIFLNFLEFSRILVNFLEFLWIFMNFLRFSSIFLNFRRFPWFFVNLQKCTNRMRRSRDAYENTSAIYRSTLLSTLLITCITKL